MRPNRLEFRAWWGAALMLPLLLLAPGAGRAAHAGCGHPLSIILDQLHDGYQLDPLIAGDAASSSGPVRPSDGPTRDRPVPAPCDGPGCSGRAPMPAPSAFHATEGPSHWGALEAAIALPAPSLSGRVAEGPALPRAARSISIFHPPRS